LRLLRLLHRPRPQRHQLLTYLLPRLVTRWRSTSVWTQQRKASTMHKALYNQAKLSFALSPATPLLIKAGTISASDPSLPDMAFVRTTDPRSGQPTVYLPGASVKGVLRSHAERILRTLGLSCCNPLDTKNAYNEKTGAGSCGKLIDQEKLVGSERYKRQCAACKLFGSTGVASHVQVADAYPRATVPVLTEVRTSVGIDRQLGSAASGSLFQLEVVVAGMFECTLILSNVQLWQVGLLAFCLRDLREGFVQLGSAKSRGLGVVAISDEAIEWMEVGSGSASDQVRGVGALVADRRPHGLLEADSIAVPGGAPPESDGLRWRRHFSGEAFVHLMTRIVEGPWQHMISQTVKPTA
jgi:CRISPR-associated RAMP protein (TIGR02581 family)